MNIFDFSVPAGITKLSQWNEFCNVIPPGWCIINKLITGCGATTYFLDESNKTPIILCSHRTELLTCKADAPRHVDHVHLFKRPEDCTAEDLRENLRRLHNYLNHPKFLPNPFNNESPEAPKILVTVDSLRHVLDVLKSRNELDKFTVVSDEFQCILTDASFKGDVVMNYLNDLRIMKNVIFVSATPLLEEYLDEIPLFRNIPYIRLNWSNMTTANVRSCPVQNLRKTLNSKIRTYKDIGYFEENADYKATEAVFFINSVVDILTAIKDNKLTSDEVNIICSRAKDNQKRKLKKKGFEIGRPPKEGEPHKPITFVTKCAFEGVDFYNTNAYTYIFANPNRNNLSIDIGIDVHQILGRQRLHDVNPWWNYATIYFTNSGDSMSYSELESIQRDKEDYSVEMASYINDDTSKNKSKKIEDLQVLHDVHYFEKEYLSVVTDPFSGKQVAIQNELVKINEKRAWKIRYCDYVDNYMVLSKLQADFNVSNNMLQPLVDYFNVHGEFVERMKFYCQFREDNPSSSTEIDNSVSIPAKFSKYYRTLGPEKIKSVSYIEEKIKNLIKTVELNNEIQEAILKEFSGVTRILKSEAKDRIQRIYDSFGIKKKAKATDLETCFNISSTLITNPDKTLSNGFKLTKKD